MNYAIVNNGIVTNIIWLHPMNANEFPEAVPMVDYPVQIGDILLDGVWYRDGERIRTQAEIIAEEIQDMTEALEMLGVKADG
jgi:hypothetical protein